MTVDPKLGPLPDALAGLVAAERRAPGAPPADRARVWAAIAARLPGPGGPGGVGGPSGTDGGPAAGPGAGPAGGAAAAGGAKSALPWIGAVAAAGAAASIYVATRTPARTPVPPPPPPVVAPAPAPTPAPTPEPPSGPAPRIVAVTPAVTSPAPVTATKPKSATPPPPAAADEPAEDELIERARISLARSRFDEALGLLTDHERRFPRGPMRSERELMIVRALLGTSNRKAAQERAARLRRANPDDPSLPAIDAELAK